MVLRWWWPEDELRPPRLLVVYGTIVSGMVVSVVGG
jgi:hypothetical protein